MSSKGKGKPSQNDQLEILKVSLDYVIGFRDLLRIWMLSLYC